MFSQRNNPYCESLSNCEVKIVKNIQMGKKKILGLDLGTNSIGWSLINLDFEKKDGEISGIGSRIIPMSQDILGKFDSGVSISQTAERTGYRGVRRLRQRMLLRRERLHRILNLVGFLPKHYADSIDFENKLGQFKNGKEVKLNYEKVDGKHQFLFMDSFLKMADQFKNRNIDEKLPFDLTLYYLRDKALREKISKEELAWLILNFNQKRGYYQLRGEEEEEDKSKSEDYYNLKVVDVIATDSYTGSNRWYNVVLDNDMVYSRKSKEPIFNWKGMNKEFIVTTNFDKDGNPKLDKEGNIKRSFRMVDSESDWIAIKKKTELDIIDSNKHVGTFILNALYKNPKLKINGKLVRTIERRFYKAELKAILEKQAEFHHEFKDKDLYQKCLLELYQHNESHRNSIAKNDLAKLFLDDIIFYQRPLKSKKSSISNCQYEFRRFQLNGENKIKYLKGASKSNPYFIEFRLLQFLKNLKIYQVGGEFDGKEVLEKDVTNIVFDDIQNKELLYDFLNQREEVDQKQLINFLAANDIIDKKNKGNYRWNYVLDKKYPMNPTYAAIFKRVEKIAGLNAKEFLTNEKVYGLWHLIYSVKDKEEYQKAIRTFATKNQIDKEAFFELFKAFPPFKNDYASYSEKALKKLLPLMRFGKFWSESKVNEDAKALIRDIIKRLESIDYNVSLIDESLVDDDISARLLKSFKAYKNLNPIENLNTYQACYAIYKRHSEASEVSQWKTIQDLTDYIETFKQHSLRNPIVEQVVLETLRTVKDIWNYYGKGKEGFFDEIHVELGREMKNPADKRKRISEQNTLNENTNHRIKEVLKSMVEDSKTEGDVRPFSPSHQEILKIYEDGVFNSEYTVYNDSSEDEITKIRKNSSPTKKEILKYKIWLEQGYKSPYTGEMISLSRLFSSDYEIEHVIPQSRLYDDSLTNKIICEAAVNSLKGNKTAYAFIKEYGTSKVELGSGKTVEILSLDQYEKLCNRLYKNNRTKLKKLLAEEIPEGFIERQLNDSRYISKLIKGLLSNIVREENEQEATSKHLVTMPGRITSDLKRDWGLNDKWNELIAPRFERLNEMTGTSDFGFFDQSINAFRTQVPDDIAKGFNKKRIDHRHHALDALVVACVTKDHVNYITSLNTQRNNFELVDKLRERKEVEITNNQTGEIQKRKVAKSYHKPWPTFTTDTKKQLETTLVSFKQNLRVINKTNNKYLSYKNEDGTLRIGKNGMPKKELIPQKKGDSWAIRKPMHKETVSGKVLLAKGKEVQLNKVIKEPHLIVNQKIKWLVEQKLEEFENDSAKTIAYFKKKPIQLNGDTVSKVEVYTEGTATRVELTSSLTEKQIANITDTGIQQILKNHLKNYVKDDGKLNPELAFNAEGLKEMNENIVALNNGKTHQPIKKVRIFEESNKFNIGHTGNKKDKYVEAAKGTNLFFSIYKTTDKKGNSMRVYATVPLNEVIEHQKQVAHLPKGERTDVPIDNTKGEYLFSLSPNDLVYVPTDEEIENINLVDFNNLRKDQADRVYKMVSGSSSQGFFIPSQVAKAVVNKYEFSALNKSERSTDGDMIKERCWKLKMDRLGSVVEVKKG